MDYIYFILKVLSLLVIVVLFTRLLMAAANYLGKEFGIGDFIFKFISQGMKSNSEKR